MPTPPATPAWRQARARWPALLVLAAAVVVAGAAPPLVATRSQVSVAAGLRTAVDGLAADERALRVTTNSADDPGAQTAAVDAVLASAQASGLGPARLLSARFTYPLEARAPGGALPGVILLASTDWPDRVDLVDGRLPVGPAAGGDAVEVVAPHGSPLATGDELTVGSGATPVRVVGTWAPRDADDPFWFADPGLASGTMSDRGGAVGPLLVADEGPVDALADRPLVRWVVVPDLAVVSAARLGESARALDGLPPALKAAGAFVQGASVDREAADRLADLAADGTAETALAGPAGALAATAGVLGLLAAAGAVAARTARERAVLGARGAAGPTLAAREAPAVLAVGVLAALGAAATVQALAGPGTAATSAPWWALAAAGLGCGATLTLTARARPVGGRTSGAGRWPSPGVAAVAALLAVLAGLGTWLVADPATAGGDGGPLATVRLVGAPLLLALAGMLVAAVVRAARPRLDGTLALPCATASLMAGAGALAVAGEGPAARAAWTGAGAAALAGLAVILVAARSAARWDPGRDAPHLRRVARAPRLAITVQAALAVGGGWVLGAVLAGLAGLGGVAR